jgi:hypothetical protein
MLTRSQIRKASRLMSQVGESRPGFLRDNVAAAEGPAPLRQAASRQPRAKSRSAKKKLTGKKITVKLVFEEDSETGEMRMVRK